MKRILHAMITVALVLGAVVGLVASPALAIPVPSITRSSQVVRVGIPVTFDGSASVCDTPTKVCNLSWRLSYIDRFHASHTIVQLGTAKRVTWIPTAASVNYPYVIVTLSAGNGNSTHNFRTAQQTFNVQPAR